MICIYAIVNKENGKRYIGQTRTYRRRVICHLSNLRADKPNVGTNRLLFDDFKRFGESSFYFEILEEFSEASDELLKNREHFWMLHFDSLVFGYNLRSDLSGTFCHPSTIEKIKSNHKTGERYGDEWRQKISKASKELWKDNSKKQQMAKAVSVAKEKYNFIQKTKEGLFVRKWSSIKEIVGENPNYKWQNIYSVCNGYKKSYMGFVWEKELKDA